MGGEEAVARLEESADSVGERRGEGEKRWFGRLGSLERVRKGMGKLACLGLWSCLFGLSVFSIICLCAAAWEGERRGTREERVVVTACSFVRALLSIVL